MAFDGGVSVLIMPRQHYIIHCPERAKPPEGYVCRICDIVSAPLTLWDLEIHPNVRSLAISSVIVQRSIHPVIRAEKNLERATSVELVGALTII